MQINRPAMKSLEIRGRYENINSVTAPRPIWRMSRPRAVETISEFVVRFFTPGAVASRVLLTIRKKTMTTGTVKFFNATRGFGFIEPEVVSKDAFVHISAVERAGLSYLSEGQKVSYELQPGKNGKSSAENLSVIE